MMVLAPFMAYRAMAAVRHDSYDKISLIISAAFLDEALVRAVAAAAAEIPLSRCHES